MAWSNWRVLFHKDWSPTLYSFPLLAVPLLAGSQESTGLRLRIPFQEATSLMVQLISYPSNQQASPRPSTPPPPVAQGAHSLHVSIGGNQHAPRPHNGLHHDSGHTLRPLCKDLILRIQLNAFKAAEQKRKTKTCGLPFSRGPHQMPKTSPPVPCFAIRPTRPSSRQARVRSVVSSSVAPQLKPPGCGLKNFTKPHEKQSGAQRCAKGLGLLKIRRCARMCQGISFGNERDCLRERKPSVGSQKKIKQ